MYYQKYSYIPKAENPENIIYTYNISVSVTIITRANSYHAH